MYKSRRRRPSRSRSRSSSTSNTSHSRIRRRESSQSSQNSVPNSETLVSPILAAAHRALRTAPKNSIQRDYLEYKLRTGSYVGKPKPTEHHDDTKDDSSSDEDFTERIRRFERKQLEQKRTPQPSSTQASSKSEIVFQFNNSCLPTTSKQEIVETKQPDNFTVDATSWRNTSDPLQNPLPKSELCKLKTSNSVQPTPNFVSSFIPLQSCENSNSGSNETSDPKEAPAIANLSFTPSISLDIPQPSHSSSQPDIKQQEESQPRKICFSLSRIKTTLAYDPLEKTRDRYSISKTEEAETDDSSSDEDPEESTIEDHVKISKTRPKIRFSLPEKFRDSEDDQSFVSKLYQRWFKFSWNNYDTGMIPVHLGRVPEDVPLTDFEKLQIRDEMRSIPPDIDLMRDYFTLMRDLADYYCSFQQNFKSFSVDGRKCLRMKASVKRAIPFVGFMKMLSNHSYSFDELDDWLTSLDWRLLETNRFLESPVREPLHKNHESETVQSSIINSPDASQSPEKEIAITPEDTERITNGHEKETESSRHNSSEHDTEPEMELDLEDEPDISSISDPFAEVEVDSLDGGESVDLLLEAPLTSSKGSDDDDATPFVSLYEGLEEPKIYQIDDRLPPIPVLCSRDPKSSNPVSEEQFFLEKLYNQEYYYSTKEFRIDVVPPPARPIMFLLESLKIRHLPNGKEVPIGQQVLFVLPRCSEDV